MAGDEILKVSFSIAFFFFRSSAIYDAENKCINKICGPLTPSLLPSPLFVETPWIKMVPVEEEVSSAGRGGDGGADHALEGGRAGTKGVLPAAHQGGAGASVSPCLEVKM